jgi:thiamine phosphate synthase YjbQ (UPF0047 family)
MSPRIPICHYRTLSIPPIGNDDCDSMIHGPPQQLIRVYDITNMIQQYLNEVDEQCFMSQGMIHLLSRHTTTSITINEMESLLLQHDLVQYCWQQLASPDERCSTVVLDTDDPLQKKEKSNNHDDPSTTTHEKILFKAMLSKKVRYAHNDIDQRPATIVEAQRCIQNGYNVTTDPVALQQWRDQEPINAHAHLLAMTVGQQSLSIPVVDGKLVLGQWQSILFMDFDAPRNRTIGVQCMGYQ